MTEPLSPREAATADLKTCPYYLGTGKCAHFPGVWCGEDPKCIESLTESEWVAWRRIEYPDYGWNKTMRTLIRDLHAAGWCHAKEWVDTGRDSNGAPFDDGREEHVWRRDCAAIRVGEYYVSFEPHEDDGDVAVGEGWIGRYGAEGLRRLAVALDILPPAAVDAEYPTEPKDTDNA